MTAPLPPLPPPLPDEELTAWLRLILTPGIGRSAARRLLAAFGLPQNIFTQPKSALAPHLSSAQCSALLTAPPALPAQIETTRQWLAKTDPHAPEISRRIITLGDADYPGSLLATEDPPLLLYLTGRCDLLHAHGWPPALAVVGSRMATPQGLLNARQFAQALADRLCIVSGLAQGIDGAAHEGALQQADARPDRLLTLAIVGTGADTVYPAKHRDLAHRIARHGLIISEYPLGTPPKPGNFPKRNRIISGLSLGTLVIEAALQSGSLITARLAAEQGREVFAIPGSIHSPHSRGCHALIRQGAKLVETAQDILEELPTTPATAPSAFERPPRQITLPPPPSEPTHEPPAEPAAQAPHEALPHPELLHALGADPASFDTLQSRTGWPTPQLQAALLELELTGHLARLPGGLFQRLAQA